MWEDVITTIQLYFFAEKVSYVPQSFYHYVQYNGESYTRVLSDASLHNLMGAVDKIESFFR